MNSRTHPTVRKVAPKVPNVSVITPSAIVQVAAMARSLYRDFAIVTMAAGTIDMPSCREGPPSFQSPKTNRRPAALRRLTARYYFTYQKNHSNSSLSPSAPCEACKADHQ
jgi:hypothetical protein